MDGSIDPTLMGGFESTEVDSTEEARCHEYVSQERTRANTIPDAATPQVLPTEVPPPVQLPPQEVATRFAECASAIYMASVIGTTMPGLDDMDVMRHYLAQLAMGANAMSDPLVRMLMDMISLMFHRLGALHSASANAKSPEAAVAYNAAAARLTGELRKSMVTLRELQAISMKSATYKTVAKAQPQLPSQTPDEKFVTQVISNEVPKPAQEAKDGKRKSREKTGEESATGPSRAPKSTQESRPHDRGTRATADGDSYAQTMAKLNRACHAGW